jgi:predicted ATP-grasp superfamily ATP-dependent carboligase
MNMYYTGLGIARSLGEAGIPVIGLTAQRRVYGTFTRYAKSVLSPDSRNEPEALAGFLLRMGRAMDHRAVLFPTRDDDVVFLDRFREQLEPYFILAVPESSVIQACLNKFETYLWARRAQVETPKCWLFEDEDELRHALPDIDYPCVLKPVASYEWHKGGNWKTVGGRKAVAIGSADELLAEYAVIARANVRILLQEMIPGSDDTIWIAACYLDRQSNWVAGFNTRKLLQVPEGFGTGCIVQAAERPEIFEPTRRLLQAMRFTGIAEVEYKWDAHKKEYRLIEINPRPWDQHRLGKVCGTDLVLLSYCDHAGLPVPPVEPKKSQHKWIAEDAFFMTALRLLWRRDPKAGAMFRWARGRRIYAIWSAADPLPFFAHGLLSVLPQLVAAVFQRMWRGLSRLPRRRLATAERGLAHERTLEKGSHN